MAPLITQDKSGQYFSIQGSVGSLGGAFKHAHASRLASNKKLVALNRSHRGGYVRGASSAAHGPGLSTKAAQTAGLKAGNQLAGWKSANSPDIQATTVIMPGGGPRSRARKKTRRARRRKGSRRPRPASGRKSPKKRRGSRTRRR